MTIRKFVDKLARERRQIKALAGLFKHPPVFMQEPGAPLQFDQMKSITQDANELQAFENKVLRSVTAGRGTASIIGAAFYPSR